MISRADRWKTLFELAWDGKGLTLDLAKVPDDILMQMIQWRNEKVEQENEQYQKARR